MLIMLNDNIVNNGVTVCSSASHSTILILINFFLIIFANLQNNLKLHYCYFFI